MLAIREFAMVSTAASRAARPVRARFNHLTTRQVMGTKVQVATYLSAQCQHKVRNN